MKQLFKNESTQVIFFVAVVLLSRAPFLFSGYGLDADAWELALTAKHISETGAYEVSRFPGYPVHEFICSLFYNGSYVSLNLLSTIISTIGFMFFVYTLKALRFKHVFLASFALAAVPVIYIHSTTSIDYTWALAFILVAHYFVVTDKPLSAGLFLGIAIGCRITSGAMLLPFAIMISQTNGPMKNTIRVGKLILTTVVVGCLIFFPVYEKYGMSFFTYYDVPYPPILNVLFKLSVEVWGIVGIIGILVATALLLLPAKPTSRKYLFPRAVNEKYVVAWLIAIDLYIIAFLNLPMEAGYLVPIVPFVILVFGKYLYDRAFIFFAFTLIIAPFLACIAPSDRNDAPSQSPVAVHFNSGTEHLIFDPIVGPVLSYQSRRANAIDFSENFIRSLDTIHKKTLFISGRWYTQVMMLSQTENQKNSSLQFVDYISPENMLKYTDQGFDIYYLPQQDYFNLVKNGFDVKTFGAHPYFKEAELK